jgi:DNA polymerase III delta prime subunit
MIKLINEANHLTEKSKEALLLSDQARIGYVRRSRWIGYTKAKQIEDKLEDLLSYPSKHRMPNLLIVGDTNNGKTTIINRFCEKHPRDNNECGEAIIVPVLLVEVPPVPDEASLYNAMLEELSAPHKKKDHPDQKRSQVKNISKAICLRLLILDEIHNMLAGNRSQQSGLRNAIKYLGNQLTIPIATVGTKEAFNAIQADDQLANRFEPIELPKWNMNEEYLRLLASFERMLPLWKPSNLTETSLALKLLSMSEGLIGEISSLLTKAAVEAIKNGSECISAKLLDSIDWVQPSKRKQRHNIG